MRARASKTTAGRAEAFEGRRDYGHAGEYLDHAVALDPASHLELNSRALVLAKCPTHACATASKRSATTRALRADGSKLPEYLDTLAPPPKRKTAISKRRFRR